MYYIYRITNNVNGKTYIGKRRSEETKKKISRAITGQKFSDEHKKKIAEAHKGKTPWNKDKHLSEETRKKMVESHKGQTPWNKGKRWKLVDGKRFYY